MKKIELPRTSERIRGVTLPKEGVFYVCDYDEVFKVVVGDLSEPEILDDDPYDFLDSLQHSLGVYGHPPILESNDNSVAYRFDPCADFVTVEYDINGAKGELIFRILSGDWFAASFSECGNYLMLAEPFSIDLYSVS